MSELITSFIERVGAFGVAILMFLENIFPPIPSELIMPLAGYTASQRADSSFFPLIAMISAGFTGSLAGAIFWYWIGRSFGIDRLKRFSRHHGRWLTLTPHDIDKAEAWFARYGAGAVFIGRLAPTVRTFISVPAGLAQMPFGKFLIYTAAGTLIWTSLLAIAGWSLQNQYQIVAGWLNPASTVVLIGIAIWYVYRVATFRRRVSREPADTGRLDHERPQERAGQASRRPI